MDSFLSFEENGSKTAKKPVRGRNSPYPSFTIEICVKLTTKIDNEFSNINYTLSKDISETLNLSGGSFLQQISSCVQYGLLESKMGEGYKPTALFEKIKKPLPSENVNDALIECLQLPALYQRLINDFREKQLPSEKGLANTLDRTYGVKGNAALIAARVFLRNITSLGLVAPGNIFKMDGSYIPFEESNIEDDAAEATPTINEQPQFMIKAPEQRKPIEQSEEKSKTREIPVFLQDDREAKVILPVGFTEDDLKRVLKVVNGYLP